MTATVTVTVNDEVQALDGVATVDALVDQMGYERRGLAIAVNGEVVPRSTWGRHRLAEGDQVEILTIAQGG